MSQLALNWRTLRWIKTHADFTDRYSCEYASIMCMYLQMPNGVPVATVAIGNAANAGLLAVRIIGASDPALLQKMITYQEDMEKTVMKKAACMKKSGWKEDDSEPPRTIGFQL